MSTCPAGHTSSAEDYCDVCGMPIDGAQGAGDPAVPPPPADAPADVQANGPATDGQPCPNCGTPNTAEALFCENCGYDFTTGSMPRPAEAENPLDVPAGAPVAQATQAGGTEGTSGAGDVQPPPSAATTSTKPSAPEAAAQAPDQSELTQAPAAAEQDFRWVVEMWIDPAWYEAQDSPDPLPSPGLPDVLPLRRPSILIGRKSVSRNINPEIDCGTDSGVSRRQAQLTTDGRRWFVEDLDSANGTFVGSASGALPTDPIAVGTKCELDADDRIYVGAWTRLVIREATDDERASLG